MLAKEEKRCNQRKFSWKGAKNIIETFSSWVNKQKDQYTNDYIFKYSLLFHFLISFSYSTFNKR